MFSDPLTRRELLRDSLVAVGASVALGAIPAFSEVRNAPRERGPLVGEELVKLVNPLQGTNSNYGFSRGNTLPLVSLPFGMTHWSPQTSTGGGWFFDPHARTLQGVRATHQPSPWMGEYGNFTVMAQTGPAVFEPSARASVYDPEVLHAGPDFLSVTLKRDETKLEFSPTERCGAFRFTFPAGAAGRVLIDAQSEVEMDPGAGVVTGCSRLQGMGAPKHSGCYFYARFDSPVAKATVFGDDYKPIQGNAAIGKDVGAAIEFENQATVVMTIATSFISIDQARRNLQREIGACSFDAVRAEAAQAWNKELGVVRVAGGSERDRRTFYTCLYRASLFPRVFHEYDSDGAPIHYSPFDGNLHGGVMYTDTGLWDGYHTLYPLLSLLRPQRLGEIIQGFINAYHEGGWLPQWPHPGYHGTMGGTHSDVVIADAILKNIPGFDRPAAYAAIRKNATVDPAGSTEGRRHLNDYIRLGYIPNAVSESLDYAYDDACVALAAGALGHADDAAFFSRRALNYRNVFDPGVGFMRSRNADGSWKANFDQYAWGDAYTEGGPWQWVWAAPHDPAGLIALIGGRDAFQRKLDRMLWQPPTYHVGGYGVDIHEMKEVAAVPFGQYAQSNQPVHQVLPLYAAAGCPAKLQYWSRRVMDELYSPDNLPGDEDNGEMGAWFVLMALGLFPGCPGRPAYVLGSPLFQNAWIETSAGKMLHLHAPANSRENVYVHRVARNGWDYSKLWISHSDLVESGRLDFAMAARPVQRRLRVSDLPESLSPYGSDAARVTSFATKIAINCGGSEADVFLSDYYYEGGEAVAAPGGATGISTIDLSSRQGSFAYHIPLPMTPEGQTYTIHLHFPSGGRQGVSINGKTAFADINLEGSEIPLVIKEIKDVLPRQNGFIEIRIKGFVGAKVGGRLSAIVVTS